MQFPSKKALLLGAGLAGLMAAGSWPVTTRYGVDFQWSSRRLTLFEKSVDFLSRDLQTRRLAAEVIGNDGSAEARLLKGLSWVNRHVRPTPPGFPVVDDHVLHILIRGYGAPDQRAEAFALLASYSGFPAVAKVLQPAGSAHSIDVVVVRAEGRRWLFDVSREIAFRNAQGHLADLDELIRHRELIANTAPGLVVQGTPYERYFDALQQLRLDYSRMEKQKVWPRLWLELGACFKARQ